MEQRIAAVCLVVLFIATGAYAQSQRTFVASTGSDANPCSRTAPCRNFAAAVAAVQDGGEVIVLDSAGYGPVTIGKSVSIVAPAGVYAGITGFSGDAVTINTAPGTVTLRGLTLTGLGASYGIDVTEISTLFIENCDVRNFTAIGVLVLPATSVPAVFIDGVESRNNDSGFFLGAGVSARIGHSRAMKNAGYGFYFSSGVAVSAAALHDSSATMNGNGVYVSGPYQVDIRNFVATLNTWGVRAEPGSVVSVCSSMLTVNSIALANDSASLYSCGDNQERGNSSPDSGTISPLAMH